jgi:hypothetical protein
MKSVNPYLNFNGNTEEPATRFFTLCSPRLHDTRPIRSLS